MQPIVKAARGVEERTVRSPFSLGFQGSGGRKRVSLFRRISQGVSALLIMAGASALFMQWPHQLYQGARAEVASLAGQLGFEIRAVRLSGNEEVSDQTVLFALNARPGEAIFDYDVAAAKERVKALQWVKDVSIQRLWPDTLQVTIEERKPFALWQSGGRIWVIDASGHPLEELSSETFAGLPLLVGFGANKRAEEILALMAEHTALQAQVKAYVRVADRRWNLRLQNGADVKLPEDDVADTLSFLAELDEREKLLSRDIEAVDLRLPDRISVRLTETALMQREAAMKEARGEARTPGGRT